VWQAICGVAEEEAAAESAERERDAAVARLFRSDAVVARARCSG
jgi:hypothetical protein